MALIAEPGIAWSSRSPPLWTLRILRCSRRCAVPLSRSLAAPAGTVSEKSAVARSVSPADAVVCTAARCSAQSTGTHCLTNARQAAWGYRGNVFFNLCNGRCTAPGRPGPADGAAAEFENREFPANSAIPCCPQSDSAQVTFRSVAPRRERRMNRSGPTARRLRVHSGIHGHPSPCSGTASRKIENQSSGYIYSGHGNHRDCSGRFCGTTSLAEWPTATSCTGPCAPLPRTPVPLHCPTRGLERTPLGQ